VSAHFSGDADDALAFADAGGVEVMRHLPAHEFGRAISGSSDAWTRR